MSTIIWIKNDLINKSLFGDHNGLLIYTKESIVFSFNEATISFSIDIIKF